ncbi:MAG: YceI family protein [Alphaproteobacteria bacterium]|uniref:YceI family protein n=1 Tax=Candidatus Nitrobium versatile TaxID=2884831 RepID=A0A953M0B5_9BACT|nr:YceI family protein [Candidatus Nitrobium versatile]
MGTWNIDSDHSVAAFAVRHMMIAMVRGQFNKLSGSINFDPADVARSSVDVAIEVASITTGIPKRDEHLRSPDFFDAEKYPKITFRSTGVEIAGGNRVRVTGDLTLHGITRTITFAAEYFGPVKAPYGGEISMGFSAFITLNREGFGILWNETLEAGGVMVGNEVQISLDVEADFAADQ